MSSLFGEIFLPTSNNDINGIIHKVRNIKVTCNSTKEADNEAICENAIKPSINYHYCAVQSLENSWLSISFPNKYIYITNYSVQAPNTDVQPLWASPISWNFYGIGMHGEKRLIDYVNESFLDRGSKYVTTRKTELEGPFNSFNLTMIGKNYQKQPALRIFKIDIFGIIKTRIYFSSCLRTRNNYRIRFIFCVCLSMP